MLQKIAPGMLKHLQSVKANDYLHYRNEIKMAMEELAAYRGLCTLEEVEELTAAKREGRIFDAVEMAKIAVMGMALQKYTDAFEQGRLVVLPCKVGDTVHELCTEGSIRETKVTDFRIHIDCSTGEEHLMIGLPYINRTAQAVGISMFFTRDEAEAALAARKGAERSRQ